MKRSSGPRNPANLSGSVNHQINMYVLAAGAAGVGLLALAPAADAKIVYTRAHVKIQGDKPFPLDLNHDGIVDFYVLHSWSHFAYKHFLAACQSLYSYHGPFCFVARSTNRIRANVSGFGAALPYGAKIQHGDRFIDSCKPLLGEVSYDTKSDIRWFGPWMNGGKGVKDRYLGLKVKIKGRFHFGWARITVTTTSNNFTATLTGYAYETIPNKAIIAGKTKGPGVTTVYPASLGHLAAGASAIPAWRVKQTVATTH